MNNPCPKDLTTPNKQMNGVRIGYKIQINDEGDDWQVLVSYVLWVLFI